MGQQLNNIVHKMPKNDKKIVVIALGGNALIQEGEKGTIQEQFANTRKSIEGIVYCIKKGFEAILFGTMFVKCVQ